MAGRIPCFVQPCRRTIAADNPKGWTEHICQNHWRIIPRSKRAIYTRVKRRARMNPTAENLAACRRIWGRMKRFAIMGGL